MGQRNSPVRLQEMRILVKHNAELAAMASIPRVFISGPGHYALNCHRLFVRDISGIS